MEAKKYITNYIDGCIAYLIEKILSNTDKKYPNVSVISVNLDLKKC
jgi:hypothetical protein